MATVIWVLLFPSLFMIHDFEEIIYGHSWFNKNISMIKRKVPKKIMVKIEKTLDNSATQFACAVCEEFIILVSLSILTIMYHWHAFYVCLMLGYCVHAAIHLFQSIYLKTYVPATGTAVGTSLLVIYGTFVIIRAQKLHLLPILLGLPFMMALIFLNVVFAHWLSKHLLK